MQTRRLYVLTLIRDTNEVGATEHVWALMGFLLAIFGRCFFCGSFCCYVSCSSDLLALMCDVSSCFFVLSSLPHIKSKFK